MCGQYLSRDVRWYHVTFTWLMLLPFVRPADIGFCDTAVTTDVIVRILKAKNDNQHAKCECDISPSGRLTVHTAYNLTITNSDCGEEFYIYFNKKKQFLRCSDDEISVAANNSLVFGYISHGMWLYYMWKEEIPKSNSGHIEVKLEATRGNVTVHCNRNDERTEATTQTILKPTGSFTPTTTRSQLSTESMTWGITIGATTDDPDGTSSLITSTSTVAEQGRGTDAGTLVNTNDNFIIIPAVVAVAVVIVIITIISVFFYRRRQKSTNNTGGESNGGVSQGVMYAEPNKLRQTPRTTQSIHRRGSDELEPVPVPEKSWEHENGGNIYYNETAISSHSNHYDTTVSIMVENELYAHACLS